MELRLFCTNPSRQRQWKLAYLVKNDAIRYTINHLFIIKQSLGPCIFSDITDLNQTWPPITTSDKYPVHEFKFLYFRLQTYRPFPVFVVHLNGFWTSIIYKYSHLRHFRYGLHTFCIIVVQYCAFFGNISNVSYFCRIHFTISLGLGHGVFPYKTASRYRTATIPWIFSIEMDYHLFYNVFMRTSSQYNFLGSLLLTWFNFNPNMNK